MDVDTAASGRREKFQRQDTAVRDDHCYVSAVGGEELLRLVVFYPLGLMNRETARHGEVFDGGE